MSRRGRRGGSRAWQTSASDPGQTRAADRLERRRRELELEDLRLVVGSRGGRRFLWRLLQYCNVHKSVYPLVDTALEDPVLRMAHSAGRQDVGHWIEVELAEAADEVLLLMMREAKHDERQLADEAEAERTPPAGERPDDDESEVTT